MQIIAITAIIIIVIFAGAAASRLDHRRYLQCMSGIGGLLLISEIWKQIVLTVVVNGGHYNVWYFPFQLCSLPMYLCPLMGRMPERWQRRIQVFLMDFTLMGGIAVFLDTSGMHYPILPLTVHSYVWHMMLIFIGSWSGFDWVRNSETKARISKTTAMNNELKVTNSVATTVNNEVTTENKRWISEKLSVHRLRMDVGDWACILPVWLICVNLATLFNVILWKFGEISMFYISPFEASTQMVIHGIAMRYGIQVGNVVYLGVMALAAAVFHVGWRMLRCLQLK